ncbi:MAG TPA: hypothetical protein VF627_06655 [Abditibacterium sp.]
MRYILAVLGGKTKKPAANWQRAEFQGVSSAKDSNGAEKRAMLGDESGHCGHCVGRSKRGRKQSGRNRWSWQSRRYSQGTATGAGWFKTYSAVVGLVKGFSVLFLKISLKLLKMGLDNPRRGQL